MLISTSTNLTSTNLAAYLATKQMPTIAQLPGTLIGNPAGTGRRGSGSSSDEASLGCASYDGNGVMASGMTCEISSQISCADVHTVNQGNDLGNAHEDIRGSHSTKLAVETNEVRRSVNYQPIWKPVAFINNLNRLTWRWQEPSI